MFTVSRSIVSLVVFASLNLATAAIGAYSYNDLYTLTNPTGYFGVQALDASAGQVVGIGTDNTNPAIAHGFLWNGAGAPSDLMGTGFNSFTSGQVVATDGIHQVGVASGGSTNNMPHAMLWSGTASSFVDLTPAIFFANTVSIANGLFGNQQVGDVNSAATGNVNNAFLWNGSSGVDLNPTNLVGITMTNAWATDGVHQVGYGQGTTTGPRHAVMWSGTANSAIDLNPSSVTSSSALGVSGNQEVGTAGKIHHAALWTGSPDSFVDLNPLGYSSSSANATNGQQQVGVATDAITGNNHALVWNGSPDDYFDLGNLLPSTFTSSVAWTIDSAGDVFGTAIDTSGNIHAIEWTPEPSSLSILALAASGLLRRRRPAIRPLPS